MQNNNNPRPWWMVLKITPYIALFLISGWQSKKKKCFSLPGGNLPLKSHCEAQYILGLNALHRTLPGGGEFSVNARRRQRSEGVGLETDLSGGTELDTTPAKHQNNAPGRLRRDAATASSGVVQSQTINM